MFRAVRLVLLLGVFLGVVLPGSLAEGLRQCHLVSGLTLSRLLSEAEWDGGTHGWSEDWTEARLDLLVARARVLGS